MDPITPAQARLAYSKRVIPDTVFEVINSMIVEKLRNNSATLKQDDIVAALAKRGLDRQEIFDKRWLDIEAHYRRAGWNVVFDKPAYCESYPATFTFSTG